MCIQERKPQTFSLQFRAPWQAGFKHNKQCYSEADQCSPKHSLRTSTAAMTHACKGKTLFDFYYLEQETAPTPWAWPNPWATQTTLPSLFIRHTRMLLSCNGKEQTVIRLPCIYYICKPGYSVAFKPVSLPAFIRAREQHLKGVMEDSCILGM